MWCSRTIAFLAGVAFFALPGCERKVEVGSQSFRRVPLEKQTLLLRKAAAEARAGRRKRALQLAEEANALSGKTPITVGQFRYDVPSSWCYIYDGDGVFTAAHYSRVRRQAADLAAASMGLLVELNRTDGFDFAQEFAEFIEPLTVQKVAEEQARRGEPEKAAAWVDRLPASLREHAKRGIAEAMKSRTDR